MPTGMILFSKLIALSVHNLFSIIADMKVSTKQKYLSASIAVGMALLPVFAAGSDQNFDCDNASNSYQAGQCARQRFERAEDDLTWYLLNLLELNQSDAELNQSVLKAQAAWIDYREAHCDSVYTKWRDGSIRGLMALSCKTNLTQRRTHELWEEFIRYSDSTEPVLPEPKVE